MEKSSRLSLPYVMEAQAQKHVTVNETFRALDALLHLAVRSRTTEAEPSSPVEGEAYILPAAKIGTNWDGFAEHAVAAYQDGAWQQYPAVEGLTAYVADEDRHIVWDGSAWEAFGSEEAARFGINASPDDTNRLSVKTDAVLFSHDDITPGTGDMRQALNKAGVADTSSLLFQTGFSGRVEIGLTGSDDLTIRVSSDGSNFLDAILIDHVTGEVSFPNSSNIGGPQAPLWVPQGANFVISADERAVWTQVTGSNANLLSPAGSSFSSGTTPVILTDTGQPSAAVTGAPRRSYDLANTDWGYTIEATIPTLPNGAQMPPQILGLDLVFDLVVDPVLGNDANVGTPAAPLATLVELRNRLAALADESTANALVKYGDYVDDPLTGLSLDTKTVTMVFEPGVTLRSMFTETGTTQAFDLTGGTLTLYGNGLHIRDWVGLEELAANDFQNSSNGLAVHGSGTLIVHDTMLSNCGDGLTAHSSGRLEAYRCHVEDCDKYAVVHVNSSTSYHEDCTFIGGDGHGGAEVRAPAGIAGAFEGSAGAHQFVRCRFLPSPSGAIDVVDGKRVASFDRCQLGTYTDRVTFKDAPITDSFVHIYAQMNTMSEPMTRCYGRASIRLRNAGAAVPVLTDCVFVGPADGQPDRFLFTNYDPGSFGQITVTDCVIMGYAEAIDIDRAESPGYWQASGSVIDSCTYFGNTSDFGTNGVAEVGSTITNSVFTDPGLGAYTSSVLMADYSAASGADGFAAGAAVSTGPAQMVTDDAWSYTDLAALGLQDGQTVRFIATDESVTDQIVSGGVLTIPTGHWKEIYGPV